MEAEGIVALVVLGPLLGAALGLVVFLILMIVQDRYDVFSKEYERMHRYIKTVAIFIVACLATPIVIILLALIVGAFS